MLLHQVNHPTSWLVFHCLLSVETAGYHLEPKLLLNFQQISSEVVVLSRSHQIALLVAGLDWTGLT